MSFFILSLTKFLVTKKLKSGNKLINQPVYADLYIKSDNLYKICVGDSIEIYKYESETSSHKYSLAKKDIGVDNFNLKSFCYSLVINYSLYGLNNKIIGDWIDPLFHKNDSYQVPIVLNPKRDKGIIDVNNEEDLAKSRLLSNLLSSEKNRPKYRKYERIYKWCSTFQVIVFI